MPKIITVQLEVPSNSRPEAMVLWLDRQLGQHRMRALCAKEGTTWVWPRDTEKMKHSDFEREAGVILGGEFVYPAK